MLVTYHAAARRKEARKECPWDFDSSRPAFGLARRSRLLLGLRRQFSARPRADHFDRDVHEFLVHGQ